jgi:hypothetical protein
MNPKKPNEAEIGRRAYELWEAEGRPEGRDVAHWHQAERDISDPVVAPIPESVPAAEPVPKPRATRVPKPKATDAAAAGPEAAAKPKPARKRKSAAPGA